MIKQNLIQTFEESFRHNADLPALTDYSSNETFTYLQVAEQVAKLHSIMEQAGIANGDRIALVGRNTSRWVMVYIAAMSYGAVIVPILQDFHKEDINHIIDHSESKMLFVGSQHAELIDTDADKGLKTIISLNDFSCTFEREDNGVATLCKNIDKVFSERYPEGYAVKDIKFASVPNNQMVLLSYTSGTTGNSKGVMLTANSLMSNILYASKVACMWKRGRNVLSYLPLAHSYGGAFDMLAPLTIGTHIFLLGKLPAASILIKALGEVKPYTFLSVPLLIEKMCKSKVFPMLEKNPVKTLVKVPLLNKVIYNAINKKLRTVFGGEGFWEMNMGGAAVDPMVESLLKKINFPFTVGYGMTECGPLISYTTHSEYKATSCGAIIPGMEVRIDSSDPYRIPGEICVKGENVMLGYYKNPEATEAVLDADGWLHTGDLGIIDKDQTIYIKGRCKTMILLSNGQNIYPEQIEFKLGNLPLVQESLVVSEGNKLVALVYPNQDEIAAQNLSTDDVKRIMDENLEKINGSVAPYEKLSEIRLRDKEFEKTPKKSIKRYLYTSM